MKDEVCDATGDAILPYDWIIIKIINPTFIITISAPLGRGASSSCPFPFFHTTTSLHPQIQKTKTITMKKFFSIFMIAITLAAFTPLQKAEAQTQTIKTSITLSQATVSGADTSDASFFVDKTHKSYTAKVVKSSGTLAGKVYFYGTVDESNYDKLDSLTLANVSTDQIKTFSFGTTNQPYYKYKVAIETTGGVAAVTLYRIRRGD